MDYPWITLIVPRTSENRRAKDLVSGRSWVLGFLAIALSMLLLAWHHDSHPIGSEPTMLLADIIKHHDYLTVCWVKICKGFYYCIGILKH